MSEGGGSHRQFLMPGGRRMAAVTTGQMREIDRIAVEETGPTLLQMMENAGRSMAVLALKLMAGAARSCTVAVLAGRGGNGGGGICAARHLAPRVGRVSLYMDDPERARDATRRQLALYGGTADAIMAIEAATAAVEPYDLIIDSMIGYGLRGAPRGWAARAIEWVNRSDAIVLSLDVPSGLDADTGRAPGACVRADATLTLHMPKPGLESPAAGRLFVADLGIPAAVTRRLGIEVPQYGSGFIARLERERRSRPEKGAVQDSSV